jgi:CPA2 family monovalent cation:H+ antiporter-2
MENSLHLVLILLAAAVLVVILFRQLKLPAMIGYLLCGRSNRSAQRWTHSGY